MLLGPVLVKPSVQRVIPVRLGLLTSVRQSSPKVMEYQNTLQEVVLRPGESGTTRSQQQDRSLHHKIAIATTHCCHRVHLVPDTRDRFLQHRAGTAAVPSTSLSKSMAVSGPPRNLQARRQKWPFYCGSRLTDMRVYCNDPRAPASTNHSKQQGH